MIKFIYLLFIYLFLILNCSNNNVIIKKYYNYNDIYDLYLNGKYEKALSQINNIQIEDYNLYILSGNLCLKLNNITEAEFYFNKAYNLNKNEEAGLNLVNLLMLRNDRNSAIKILEELYNSNKYEALYPFLLGILYKELMEYDQSLEYFTYSLNSDFQPEKEIYYNISEIHKLNVNSSINKKYSNLFSRAFNELEEIKNKKKDILINLEILINKKYYSKAIDLIKAILIENNSDENLNILLGDLYYLNSEIDQAIILYNSLLLKNPKLFVAYIGLINCNIKLNNYEIVRNLISKTKQLFKDNSDIYYKSCVYNDLILDYSSAILDCKQSILLKTIQPNDKLLKLGDLYIKTNNPSEALKIYSELKGKIPNNLYEDRIRTCNSILSIINSKKNIEIGNIEKGLIDAKKSLQYINNLNSEFFYSKFIFNYIDQKEGIKLLIDIFKKYNYFPIILFLKENTSSTFLPLLEELELIEYPSDYKINIETGMFYEEEENYHQAIIFYNKVLSNENDHFIRNRIGLCYYLLSNKYFKEKNYEQALQNIKKAKFYKVDNNIIKLELTTISCIEKNKFKNIYSKIEELEKKGNFKEALFLYKNLYKNNKNLEIADKIINIYIKNKDIEKLLEFIDTENFSKFLEGKEFLANIYLKIGYLSEAKTLCLEIINNNPSSLTSYIILGTIYLEENLDESIKYFNLALAYSSESIEALNGLGIAYYNSTNFLKAKKYFNLALSLEPSNNISIYNLVIIHIKERNVKSAENLLRNLNEKEFKNDYNYLKSYLLYIKGNYKEALFLIEELIKNVQIIKYYDLLLKISKKNSAPIHAINEIKTKISELELIENDFHNSSNSVIAFIEIKEKLIHTPIKIKNGYLLNNGMNIKLMNNSFSRILWKINGTFVSIFNYSSESILVLNNNELLLIDITNGTARWKFSFEYSIQPIVILRNNIFLYFKDSNKNNSLIFKINQNGKVISRKEFNSIFELYVDYSEYLYFFKNKQTILEWSIYNSNFDTIIERKTLFTFNYDSLEEVKSFKDNIILHKGIFIYKFYQDGKIQIKKMSSNNFNIILLNNKINLLSKVSLCELNEEDLSCNLIEGTFSKKEIFDSNNKYLYEYNELQINGLNKTNYNKTIDLKNIKNNSIIKLSLPKKYP
jgi:tetratricopeptide (TPR) repeat protein